MTKLTEHTVLARTRAQDLKSVRKLNAWGSELTDVSIVKKLPNVEVLSLSVNSISSLEDFSHCNNLQELYIRKNNITELAEIRHLRDLQKLKNLWLADNPCAECDDYRLTVIRALPQLQKLDNVPIRPDEIESAKKHGSPLELLLPKSEEEPQQQFSAISEAVVTQTSMNYEENSIAHSESYSVETNVVSPTTSNNVVESIQTVRNNMKSESVNHTSHSSFQEKMSPEVSYEREDYSHHNSSNSIDTSPIGANHSSFAAKFQDPFDQSTPEPEPFAETPTGSSSSKEHFSPKCAYAPPCPTRRCERPTAIRMLPKGGKSRSVHTAPCFPHLLEQLCSKHLYRQAANILSAVLCLIKELDWASLEVVDTAIHCQMEELEEQHSSS